MKKLTALIAVLAICLLSFASCADKTDDDIAVNVSVLSGTTGFGMAELMDKNSKNESKNKYNFTVETDASVITAGLINGSVDIAALPTNAASVLYNKTNGGIKLLALNTKGVLYLLDNGNNITSFADLKGKTVYVPAQNPTFIFTYLCQCNGICVGSDVMIESMASPAEIQSKLIAGAVTLAVLPEPLTTVTIEKNAEVKLALDLTAEWNKVNADDTLYQGCIVARSEFINAHKSVVDRFINEYSESVNYAINDNAAAGTVIADQGIFANAAIASKAIARCNLCCITGKDMKEKMNVFLNVMLESQASSIGGKVPGDDFYYVK